MERSASTQCQWPGWPRGPGWQPGPATPSRGSHSTSQNRFPPGSEEVTCQPRDPHRLRAPDVEMGVASWVLKRTHVGTGGPAVPAGKPAARGGLLRGA